MAWHYIGTLTHTLSLECSELSSRLKGCSSLVDRTYWMHWALTVCCVCFSRDVAHIQDCESKKQRRCMKVKWQSWHPVRLRIPWVAMAKQSATSSLGWRQAKAQSNSRSDCYLCAHVILLCNRQMCQQSLKTSSAWLSSAHRWLDEMLRKQRWTRQKPLS